MKWKLAIPILFIGAILFIGNMIHNILNENLKLPVMLFIIGSLLIFGNIFNVKFIVDPPEYWSPFYSSAYIKEKYGVNVLKKFNYFFGSAAIIGGIIILTKLDVFFLWRFFWAHFLK